MRHRKRSRRLVGKWEHRQALLRNLLMALFVHERIKTTEAKAKELRRLADKMIMLAKRGDLAARRQALSILPDKAVIRKLFSEIKDRYAYRQSGFTRIVRIGPRRGDAAMMVFIELVTDKLEHKRSPRKVKAEEEAQAEAPKVEAAEAGTAETEEKEAVEAAAAEEASAEAEEAAAEEAASQEEVKASAETESEAEAGQEETTSETPEEKPESSSEATSEETEEKTEEKPS